MTPPMNAACEQLLRKPAVAQTIGVGVRTLERLVSTRAVPGPDIKIGSRLLLWRAPTGQRGIEEQAQRQRRGGVR